MTPLSPRLAERIRAEGPLSLAAFMAAALADPRDGYYMTRDPFGRGGDFTTAPEISQIFGELIGLWALLVWQSMGSPGRVVLAELGPGRGTLMSDLLRAARVRPAFAAALDVHLVEISPTLRNRQAQTLAEHRVRWVERVEDLPDGPLILIANELFDALPIRQIEAQGGVWHERRVGLDAAGGFAFTLGEAVPPPAYAGPPTDGTIAEIGEAASALAATIGARLAHSVGAALIIDYGYDQSGPGDSVQAMRGHAAHPVLADPGNADLTAHVDFERLAAAAMAAGAGAHGPLPQGVWLGRMGIEERAVMLMRGLSPERAAELAAGARRLIDPGEMGTLFRVLALTHPSLPVPPGLDPQEPPR
jgi:NADH dehydrogenase [ubiquinone] 1 alpha subcomplex assembly factor 7